MNRLPTSRFEPQDFIGTMNPEALKLPALQNKKKPHPYEKFADLALQIDNIVKQIDEEQEKIDNMLASDKPTPFCTFKKWLLDFEERIKERDNELNIFSKHLTSFREKVDPTFVEVDSANEKTPSYDTISYSLLVSNEQRNFFSKQDIVHQNNELKILIHEQQEAISNLRSRLKIFEDFQNKNAIKHTIASLKQGTTPMALAGAAPTRANELRAKQKILSAELVALVKKRVELLKKHNEDRYMARHEKLLNQKALTIQRIWRGYLARKEIKHLNQCAVLIQKHVRGWLVRYQQKMAMEDLIVEEQKVTTKLSENNSPREEAPNE
ncbi:IQ calmodulin-binding motif family protein [Trichomonas vaginalis G3]|uniref:IQ calmodulin-binding motif family protein n=1 Tax=Trichomonas vaginalis (strain ATCC PRA-98 / G3) TaxID=412133 RepID=A2DYY0_TRIV3|nr:hypothetical protein TVAGG3_0869260 [Trichomonas vaginalis G3]EAY14391.1 IQ calmodulin-binding motif family protein [Trichomonas vaginalis G3]KAI5501250.1 hypothetical protein TVAGG3_0869260 [Trichomonas vaginalis G3]|eukprot:XP_001326614.1 IQ calmodulin-binding motif family protein [Trichomonas vaginalis G3]